MNRGFQRTIVVFILLASTFGMSCRVDENDIVPAGVLQLQSIEIRPSFPSMAPGTALQVEAFGTFSNNTSRKLTNLTWDSSDAGLATVDNAGMIASLSSAGTVTITAASDSITGSTVLTISPVASIEVTPENAAIAPNTRQQLVATGTLQNSATQDLTDSVTWSSSDSAIATIIENGLAFAASVTGETTISAVFSSISGSTVLTTTPVTSIVVTPTSPTIFPGKTKQFTAIGTLANNTTQNLTAFATWSSLSAETAAITSTGLALSLAPGPTIITAALGNFSGSAVLTVSEPVLVSIAISTDDPNFDLNTARQFTALGTFSDNTVQDITSEVTWVSSHTAVATVSNTPGTKGLITSVAAGTSSISAHFLGVSSNTITVTVTPTATAIAFIVVTPSNPLLHPGQTAQFTAMGFSSDGITQINLTATAVWSSSNGLVASVSQGLATAFANGTTTITAASGNISGSATLLVTAF